LIELLKREPLPRPIVAPAAFASWICGLSAFDPPVVSYLLTK